MPFTKVKMAGVPWWDVTREIQGPAEEQHLPTAPLGWNKPLPRAQGPGPSPSGERVPHTVRETATRSPQSWCGPWPWAVGTSGCPQMCGCLGSAPTVDKTRLSAGGRGSPADRGSGDPLALTVVMVKWLWARGHNQALHVPSACLRDEVSCTHTCKNEDRGPAERLPTFCDPVVGKALPASVSDTTALC